MMSRSLVVFFFFFFFLLGDPLHLHALPIEKRDASLETTVTDSNRKDPGITTTMDEILQINSADAQQISGGHIIRYGDVADSLMRNAMICPGDGCFWPKASDGFVYVPFTVSPVYSPSEVRAIQRAIADIANSTCVRLVPRTTEVDYLSFQSLDGCWSYFGMTGGKQAVSLKSPTCLLKGVVIHEIIHALGFYHEHNRSDRDKYVNVIWSNVQPGQEDQFSILQTNNLNTKYDYGSIMHYGRYNFAINPSMPTLEPIPNPSVSIGQLSEMSATDILKINRLYGCGGSSNMETVVQTSPSTTKRSTTTTTKPTTMAGPKCANVVLTAPFQRFNSPNFPSLYPNNANCQWLILGKSKVLLTFTAMNIQLTVNCVADYVRVYDGSSTLAKPLSPRLCGYTAPAPLTSTGPSVLVVFHSDASLQNLGFQISYRLL
ncbi:astacin-like metalloendopeptidase [Polypterus senegalus]|nr:astacin-like metalloendopeptidase [Polypterus senegalus]